MTVPNLSTIESISTAANPAAYKLEMTLRKWEALEGSSLPFTAHIWMVDMSERCDSCTLNLEVGKG